MNPYPIAARVDYENYRRPRIEKNVTCMRHLMMVYFSAEVGYV